MFKRLFVIGIFCLAIGFGFSLLKAVSEDVVDDNQGKTTPVLPIAVAPSFSLNERILENYFREQLSTTCAGYALYGEKPVYLDNSVNEYSTCIGTRSHKYALETLEVMDIWEQGYSKGDRCDYSLCIINSIANSLGSDNLVLLINRKAFLRVVNENLSLFQSRLGLSLTAEGLLSKIKDPGFSASALFKGNTALLGILLGYGTKNSLLYERGSQVIKPAFAYGPLPPPCSGVPVANSGDIIKRMKTSTVMPSFDYDSIQDEFQDIQNILAYPSDSYKDTGTKIPFSYIENSDESIQLLKMYEDAELKVAVALQTSDFLDSVLRKFSVNLDKIKKDPFDLSNPEIKKALPELVAKIIIKHLAELDLADENRECFDNFLEGIKLAEHSGFVNYDELAFFDAYQMQLTPAKRANKRLSKQVFDQKVLNSDVTWIEPAKICYCINKLGNGDACVNKYTKAVSIHYLIKDFQGEVLCSSSKLAPVETFDVLRLMPGLAHGIQGMRKNEIREVIIHPDFAYGVHADFGEGKALSVTVELVDLECAEEPLVLPSLVSIDLLHLQKDKNMSKAELDCLRSKYVQYCGFRTWQHYNKASEYVSFASVLEALERLQGGPESENDVDGFSKRVVRRLDLYIYGQS